MANSLASPVPFAGLLCEDCGYDLNGLPPQANCPECGSSIEKSAPGHRGLPAWERPGNVLARFCKTTARLLFRPKRFYRALATRRERTTSRWFASLHWLAASLLFGITASVHMRGVVVPSGIRALKMLESPVVGILVFTAATFLLLEFTTRIAARLTSWEARYRGFRLPLPVVLRGLDYHAAHYLPVALMAFVTVIGYRWMIDHGWVDDSADINYLYVLCGEVVAGAAYLFWTYWIGMRNMMYANA